MKFPETVQKMEFLNKLWKCFIKALYPDRCVLCRKTLEKGYLCDDCRNLSLPYESSRTLRIGEDRAIVRIYAPYPYEGGYRETIHRFKFDGAKAYDISLARFMAKNIPSQVFRDADMLTFVPMSRKKIKRRGYNQAELLAERLSEITGIPCREVLGKKRENLRQHTLGPKERRQNVQDVFCITGDIKGQKVLIVDDIITTGFTIEECSRTLLEGGASEANAVCAASADKSGKSIN